MKWQEKREKGRKKIKKKKKERKRKRKKRALWSVECFGVWRKW